MTQRTVSALEQEFSTTFLDVKVLVSFINHDDSIENKVIARMVKRRVRARRDRTPYCFVCDIALCNPEALFQHNRDLHNGPTEGQNMAGKS